jgi:putative ABC transport system permease protein
MQTYIIVAGTVLAAIVCAATLAVTLARLSTVMAQPAVAIPWLAIDLVAASCLLFALIASLVPAALALRTPAAGMAAVRE